MSRFPSLSMLFGAYLNQDWPDDYGEAWEAVGDYLLREPLSARGLVPEVDRLLESGQQLDETLVPEMDSGYSPELDGYTGRDWLVELRERALAFFADQLPSSTEPY